MRSEKPSKRTEDPLLPRIAIGDAGAVQEFIDRYGPLVWSIVRRSIRDHGMAEDVVQEVFIAIWRAADRYDPVLASESVYVTTIARRRLIDRYRSQMRQPELENIDELAVSHDDPHLEQLETADEARRASKAIERLRPEQRELLEMWVVRGLTHNEIATSTGIPLGTVKSQIRRGLIRVRELLQGHELAASTEASA